MSCLTCLHEGANHHGPQGSCNVCSCLEYKNTTLANVLIELWALRADVASSQRENCKDSK